MASARQTQERYRQVRSLAYQATARVLRQGLAPQARLTEIGLSALQIYRETWPDAYGLRGHEVQFDWDSLFRHYRRKYSRFEAALWDDDALCGLCYGMPSQGPQHLTLQFMEAYEGEHSLKGLVIDIMHEAANAYAFALGKQELRIEDPVEAAIPLCLRRGFELASETRGRTYYSRKVVP